MHFKTYTSKIENNNALVGIIKFDDGNTLLAKVVFYFFHSTFVIKKHLRNGKTIFLNRYCFNRLK
jgi:hypothetical protein